MEQSPGNKSWFDRVVEATGLSGVIGPGVVRRALQDAGVEPEQAGSSELLHALEALERRLEMYMSEEQASECCRNVKQLLVTGRRDGASARQSPSSPRRPSDPAASSSPKEPSTEQDGDASDEEPDSSVTLQRSIELLRGARERLSDATGGHDDGEPSKDTRGSGDDGTS